MDIKRKQKFLIEAAYIAVILALVYVTFKYFHSTYIPICIWVLLLHLPLNPSFGQ
jgi:hypothetical protein